MHLLEKTIKINEKRIKIDFLILIWSLLLIILTLINKYQTN